ncbi:hypothetical protein L2E82_45307 [Cichorium intybus]|uniref:Uncharacterized protein n=1 Tax=Cichorium intybus TaxID=13427 RepID=A0ACB8ZSM5_CICIN|nr:hypothetical protein L2E82_45307 [Cichorium intybus]
MFMQFLKVLGKNGRICPLYIFCRNLDQIYPYLVFLAAWFWAAICLVQIGIAHCFFWLKFGVKYIAILMG